MTAGLAVHRTSSSVQFALDWSRVGVLTHRRPTTELTRRAAASPLPWLPTGELLLADDATHPDRRGARRLDDHAGAVCRRSR